MRPLLVAAIVLVTFVAQAEDETAARAHYRAAQTSFDQAHFADALAEYEEAYRLAPYPAILYREGLCLEQLGRYGEAADTLERYLAGDPKTTRRDSVERSIARLRGLAHPTPKPPVAPPAHPPAPAPSLATPAPPPPAPVAPARPQHTSRWLAPGLVLGGAAVAAGVAAGLIGSVAADYGSCARPCSDAAISSMQSRAWAGYALFGVAGAAAVVDVALFIVAARRGQARSFAARAWTVRF